MESNEFNEDVAYEKFAQSVYQTLLNNEDIKTTEVQHNLNIEGRSGCKHQIDVYWEYEIADVLHRVAIECKNYNTSNISIGRIRDFFGALNDIGNISGIFVCKSGYQSGAIKFADYYGINLKELRAPTDKDWEGRVETIQINTSILHTDIKKRDFYFDEQWCKEKYSEQDLRKKYSIKGFTDEIIIKEKDGNKITSMYELENNLPHNWTEEKNREHTYEYNDAYIEFKNLGSVKILGIKFTYDVLTTSPESIIISGKETAKAILKDVKTGLIKYFDKKGNVKII
jgi:hypothetical protein